MKLKFKTQAYQTAAVQAVVDCFRGQPQASAESISYRIDPGKAKKGVEDLFAEGGFKNADLKLTDIVLLENITQVQHQQNLPQSSALVKNKVSRVNLDIEMETGTGKTYCYIKTIFELNKQFGWSKFIIVVPSIAIREGVAKSLEITAEHFLETYHKKARFFIYNSKQLHHLESFSSDAGVNVMVINMQAFAARGADPGRAAEDGRRRHIEVLGGIQCADGAALLGHPQDHSQQNPPAGRARRLQPEASEKDRRARHLSEGAGRNQCLSIPAVDRNFEQGPCGPC
jgi:type III restriction enzyme